MSRSQGNDFDKGTRSLSQQLSGDKQVLRRIDGVLGKFRKDRVERAILKSCDFCLAHVSSPIVSQKLRSVFAPTRFTSSWNLAPQISFLLESSLLEMRKVLLNMASRHTIHHRPYLLRPLSLRRKKRSTTELSEEKLKDRFLALWKRSAVGNGKES